MKAVLKHSSFEVFAGLRNHHDGVEVAGRIITVPRAGGPLAVGDVAGVLSKVDVVELLLAEPNQPAEAVLLCDDAGEDAWEVLLERVRTPGELALGGF